MFVHHYPHFQKGRVLKKEMLESLRDIPKDLFELTFQEYSNGIIKGVNIRVEKTTLVITKGVVKHNHRLYVLDSDFQLPYRATEKETLLKVRFLEEETQSDFTSYKADIVLDTVMQVADNELELGRFKLKSGAVLRSSYEDFLDFSTEFNTLNYIHCDYAGFQTTTLHPLILNYFAKELLSYAPTNGYDLAFAFQCLNQERVHREVLLYYVSNRLGLIYQDYTNNQIHNYLNRILLEAKGTRRSTPEFGYKSQRMIVD